MEGGSGTLQGNAELAFCVCEREDRELTEIAH